MARVVKIQSNFQNFCVIKITCILITIFSFYNGYSQQSYSISTCSGTAFTFNEPGAVVGETYSWSFPASSPGGSINGASAQTGQTAVSQTLVNNTNVVTATVTYIVATSQGTNFNLVVTVNPNPVIANQVSTICSGSSFNLVPINVPAGTTYTWSAPTINPTGSVSGSSAQPSAQIFIGGQTLTNPTINPATVAYTVTPSAGLCAGNSFLVTVTVNPKPVLNNSGSSPVAICSGFTYGYTPTSATTGTTINWSRSVFTGINNAAGSGSNNPNEILNNATNPPAAVTVNYVFTLSANGCSNSQTIPVIVNPKPILSSTLSAPAICSGTTFNYTPASVLASSPTFAWSRVGTAGINGGVASPGGTGNVSEALVNSTTQAITVFYSYTITDGVTGCTSTPQFVGVTVNPAPAAIDVAISSCNGNKFFYVPANVPNGTLYSWTANLVGAGTTIGYSSAVGQYFVGQTLASTGVVDYTVTPSNNGCTGGSFHVLVTVTNGAVVPLISNTSGLNICSSSSNPFTYIPNSTAVNPTYNWTRFYTPGISSATNTGSTSVSEILTNSSTIPLTANYGFRTTDNNGCTNTQLIQVTVNPIATLTTTLSPLPICSNATFNYTPSANVTGTIFSWTRAVFGTNAANSGSGNGGNPAEVLVNVNTSALPVSYLYTLQTPSGCLNTQTVTVSVNPLPVLSSSPNPGAICSGTIFTYTPSSATPSPVFNWTRNVLASISNGAGSGIGNPAEVLVNTSNTAVTVPYNYTILANGCSNTQTVNVVVNPAPNVANQTATTCSNTSLTVTPTNVPIGTQYTWGLPVISPFGSISNASTGTSQNNITQNLTNGISNPATATYTVTPVANGCNGSPFTLAVNVSIISTLSSSITPFPICSNTTFSYTPTSSTAGTSFSWTRNPVSGISNAVATGTGNPNETLVNTTSNAIPVPYTYALNTPDGCVSTQTVTISVKPLPTLSSAQPNAICSGTIFNYTPTSATANPGFSWSRAVLAAISNGAASGINNPAEVLVNTTTNAVIVPYAYILTANGCSNPQTVNVLVKPTPNIPDQVASSCNNTAFTVSPANVPAGTAYTWTVPTYSPGGSIINGSAQPIAQTTISQTLNNTTPSPATATYTVTPAANGCTGTSFLVTVTVNTATVLSTSLTPPAVCSNAVFTYNPASNTPGASFSWTRAAIPGISNTAAAGINNPNEKLINITTDPVSVPYTYSLNTPNACLNTQTVTVIVNPSPVLTSTLTPAAICSGSVFNYTPASATAGVSYSWNRTVQPSISNGPGSGSGPVNPSELLVNTTINPVTVSYNYILTANSCTNAQTVNVIVNPTPTVGNQTQTICGNTVFNISPVNIPAATQYTWNLPVINPAGAIGGTSVQTVPQNNIGQLLSNQTLNAATATYTVTPVANGCTGSSFTAAVTVNPTPVIADKLLTPVCSATAFSYTPGNVPTATTYTWGFPVLGPVNGLTGGSAQPINQVLISQTLFSSNNVTDTASYIVLPSTAGCAGSSFTVTIPVKPVPVVNNVRDTICTGSTFSVIPPSVVPLNTTYTWGAPVSVPFGSVVGGKPQATGVPVLSQTLFNSSSAIAQMVYTITPSTAGCAGNTFTLIETVGIGLAPVTNKTATICSGTTFDVTPTTTPPNTTYTWGVPAITPAASVSGSSSALSRQTIISQTLTNLTGLMSSVVYIVVPYNTGCSGTPFTATINVRPVPKASITGKSVVCRYPFDTLTVNFAGQAPWSFTYLDNNIPKTQTGITSSPFTWVLPAIPNAPTRTLSITYVNDFACVDSTDTVTFVQKVNPLPVGQIISLHGQYICNGIADTLFVSYPSSDTLQFQWTLNGLNLPGATTDSIGTLLGGRYNSVLNNQYGCIDTAAASAVVTVISKPILNFSYDSYCINNLIHFTNLTDTTFTGPIQWLWNFGDSTTSNRYNTNDTYTTAGNRHIRLSATQLYCPAYTTFIDSTINIQFPISAIRMPSVSAYKGVFTPITARTFPGYRYLWTPTRGIDRPDSASINFNYQVTQEYLINLISPAGCVTYDSVLVRVFDNNLVDILVPKSFTPNGDGINDILYPYLTGVKTFQYFKIYNRYGKLMFETTNPDAGWNGYVNGTPQPMSIYIWIAVGIANDGSQLMKRGETLLLR